MPGEPQGVSGSWQVLAPAPELPLPPAPPGDPGWLQCPRPLPSLLHRWPPSVMQGVMASEDLTLNVCSYIMKGDKGGEFHPNFPVTHPSEPLSFQTGYHHLLCRIPASPQERSALKGVFLVTLTLTQHNLTFFLRIWKAKAATGNPQSVNTVIASFLVRQQL